MTDQRGPTAVGTGSGLAVVAVLLLMVGRSGRSGVVTAVQTLHAAARSPLTRALWVLALLLGILLLACVTAVVVLRIRTTRRTLASRVSYLVLPTDDFDPSDDAVLRAAGQLGRVRRAVFGWLDPRASAVRVRLDSGPDGRMLHRVQVASRARSVVRAAFTSMGPVELREEEAQP